MGVESEEVLLLFETCYGATLPRHLLSGANMLHVSPHKIRYSIRSICS